MQHRDESFDVIVCGGGLAGICAAIAAARHGARTCIVQDRPVFGGNSSSEIRVFPQGAANYNAYARETGIIAELLIEERAVNHEPNSENGRTNSVWDLILYDKIISTPYLSHYLNTSVYALEMGDSKEIKAIHARIGNAETELTLHANIFIDCTGDGILAELSGCEWRMGTEGQEEFGEHHAPPTASADVMGSSIHFRAKDMGKPVPFQAPAWAFHYDNPDVFYKGGRVPHDPEGGFWWIELGVPWNTITENETIRHELTRHVMGIWDFMKNKDPELMEKSKHYALDWIGQVPGKRESRRIMGHYLLTEADLVNQPAFEDEVAFGGWYIDLHKSGGLLAEYSEQSVAEGEDSAYMKKSYIAPYGIPLRSLIAKDVSNLLMAGRNISASHVALGSSRVMGTTALLGQAAGTAAAVALIQGESLSALSATTIKELKQRLIRDDCFLLHESNADPFDLARTATPTASSEARLRRVEPKQVSNECHTLDESEHLSEKRGQWIAIGTEEVEALSVCLSNPTEQIQWVEASIVAVQHIWDYATDIEPKLAQTKLAVPPGRLQWIRWEMNMTPGLKQSAGFIRLDIAAHPHLYWHKAANIVPGMVAASDMDNGLMRRYENGETLAFQIEPEQSSYPPENVLSGVTRPYKSTNLWRSSPSESMPQWIGLTWREEQVISQVEVTFAGNLLRDYRFYSPFNQDPQCVKVYELQAWIANGWATLDRVDNNYNRKRIHRLAQAVHTTQIRVLIHETNGDPSAAVYEVRVYE
ncbi:FAD-dependent oxidoreductase [Paenibacillus qinlingensis]|uniref:FAD-dependent oxidoreductase n=1 Tax=Paenibacillus qinlingensis TaxID=1837343 RepID=UPI0015635FF5|nr:FAD-dependent oxidoreductase [Paenibacillus qinlingensis]NQX63321.1 FAD-dependent oxidoreductase [Paenibacillus qinlingensis]